jgi:O-antigen/teichoic acid export membrane protein
MNRNLSGAMYLIVQSVILNVVSVPAIAIIIRNIGPAQFGLWGVTTAVVAITSFLTNLGLREIFLRSLVQQPEETESLIGYQMGLRFVLSLLASAFCLLFCLLFRYGREMFVLTLINAAAMVLTTLASVLLDYLLANNRQKAMAVTQLVAGLVLTLLSVVLTTLHPSLLMLGTAYFCGPLLLLILLIVTLLRGGVRLRMRFDADQFRALMEKSRVLILPQLLSTLRERLEPLIVPKIIGMDAFGYFSAGTMPVSRMNIVADGIVASYYSTLAKKSMQSAEATEATAEIVLQLMKVILLVCLPIACYLYCMAEPVAFILFPKKPDICATIMRLTCWALPITAVGQVYACVLQSTGKFPEAARCVSLGTLIGAALTLLCAYRWGITGACAALVARNGIVTLLLYREIQKLYPAAIYRLPLIPLFGSAALIFLVFLVSKIDQSLLSLRVVGFFLVSACAYIAALVLFKVLSVVQLRALILQRGKKNAA